MSDIPTATGGLLDGLLTCKQVAAQLGKSERHVKRMARRGLLELVRIGRTDFYDVEGSRARLRGKCPEPEGHRGADNAPAA